MKNNVLDLRSINKLLVEKFYIPDYQRGYRWEPLQVEALITDVWSFRENPPKHEEGKEKPFYSLQPIVVKLCDKGWEVIDGQQRLTTIFIILKYFNLTEYTNRPKKVFGIEYQTRNNCIEFFQDIENEELAETNIDFYHINLAHKTIDKWFTKKEEENDTIRHDFRSSLINDVKVIWYEVNESDSSSIDIFTRLNIGKIPLNNAELVRALFLQKSNFDEDKVNLKQLQIASEWDSIEKVLQNDAFWYFIYNTDNPIQYDNRIEYIFDLMKQKTKDEETLLTFYKFQKDFIASKKENGKPDIDGLWLKIKKYFLSIEEWYNNRELYHLIGFLVDCGYSIKKLKEESEKMTKTTFKGYLRNEIREQVHCKFEELEELIYGDKRIKKILLLFNIQTILSTDNTDIRFPFNRYKDKNEQWDIEHVRSQTDKQITGNDRREWALDILEYYTGEKGYSDRNVNGNQKTEKELQKEVTETLEGEAKVFAQKIIKILESEKIEDEYFNKLYKDLTDNFGELKQPDNINSISNLALLNAAINRSYKNAMFPIKRKTIIENDMNGIFIPICTKNLFLKSYSKKMGDVMYWKHTDANDYLAVIKKTLTDYLPIKDENHE